MFSKTHGPALPDLSTDLSEDIDWKIGPLRTFNFPLNITALAVEPIAGILAVGTASGDIYLFGGPSVESKVSLPEPVGVKFLQISSSTYFLVCLDDHSQLYLYNLLEFGRPKLVTSARFDPTNSITLSPSHTHAFLALQNGEVRTYDLTCLRKSPYTMPNMWKLYEEGLRSGGVPPLEQPTPQNAVEAVIHPRDLNLLFVAYAGGVVLTNLTDRSTVRAYDLILPPGAPGGAGYVMDDVLTPRRMMVTSIAVHPAGHFFVVGYADGSFAIWAVQDDDKPLTVRTINEVDVHMVDSTQLEAHLDNNGSAQRSIPAREPVFKVSWSAFSNSDDPRSGETVLTILGGLEMGKPPGVHIFALPPFNPQEPPATPPVPPNTLHPSFRQAMVKSITPTKSFFYQTHGIVQDYLLLPKDSPHLGGTFDAQAMLLIIDVEGTRTIAALQMPPPGFVALAVPETVQVQSNQEVDEQSDEPVSPTSLKSPQPPTPLPKSPRHLTQVQPPQELQTPFPICNGQAGILGGQLFTLDNELYENFIAQKAEDPFVLQLRGGKAWPDSSQLNELKLSKYQPRRILMTYNQDLSVRFFDLSTTLLISPPNAPLNHPWPKPIPSLSINLDALYEDKTFSESLADSLDHLSIASVQVASDALEVAVAFDSGELLVYHERTNSEATPAPQSPEEPELILLDHIRIPNPVSRIGPFFMFMPGMGPIEAHALSDVGFLVISYRQGSMVIIDMRGPRVIYTQTGDTKRHKHRSSIHIPGSPTQSGPDLFKSLKWTICPLDKDPQLRVRLLALRQSGQGEIYTLTGSGTPATWSILGEGIPFKGSTDPLADGTFVLDTKKGFELKANRPRFSASLRNEKVSTDGPACMLVAVGAKGVRVALGVNGEKVAKAEWGTKAGSAIATQVVSHSGAQALVVQTEKSVLIYSLPYLEHLTTIQPLHASPLPLSIDEGGDFVAWKGPGPNARGGHSPHVLIGGVTYGTFFDVRRAYHLPDIDFASTRPVVPAQPLPVSLGPATLLQTGMNLGSWFGLGGNKTGAQIDALLGGPDRPIPEKIAAEKARAAAEEEGVGAAGGQSSVAGLAASAVALQSNVYNRLTGALNERSQMLGDLEERFQSLEQGSKDMVSQAKRLAAQQSAKSWFGF